MTAQIVEIAGRKMAVLPVEDYARLLDIAEDRADSAAAEQAEQRRLAGEEYLPAEMIDRILNGESPLRVWRQYRGMTLAALAKAVGTVKSNLSEIENGKAQGTMPLWRALARTLDVAVDDILADA
ncbi:helix-turn-helix transcriptional regulator [Sphingosinicella sp. LHD-64]|uniref:helix-turn-helix transcriptional regulator n=1 Tax=Sphingosinicella sp. LHD-64 TaxID=3072139 RepID=UPI00280ED1CC|nr:helix-turn-helix transcriptional regulator [Sphingosinicella sp. LHD-64]MDQ8756031.1 helix-turn-helix transcriptional regulator [Sphingosinicella sp. LHD-64]